MRADIREIKRALKSFDYHKIFNKELGWDNLSEPKTSDDYKELQYTYSPVAQKKGFKIYLCQIQGRIPNQQALKQIDRPQNASAEEHLTIFVDEARENQAWFWVKKVGTQPPVTRLNRLHINQSGELLAQKIARLFVSIDEEARITLTGVLDRVNLAFDTEKVTNKFYKEFQLKHASFLRQIENITDEDDRKWYTSIMLNRLMFVYFLQRKRLLDNGSEVSLEGNDMYLQSKLERIQDQFKNQNKFYEFYTHFLCRLFHEGLNIKEEERAPGMGEIIGRVPYINGGIFDTHPLETKYPQIQIPDKAFRELFDFFEDFDWYLDDNPMRTGDEINPDVLGYIFEKYINQKEMGAYYTKEDITEYISKNTIIPFILTQVAEIFPDDFAADGFVWSLLKEKPDEYIYEELLYGCSEPLPPEIAAGLTDLTQRSGWNAQVDEQYEQYALPTETWREVVDRRNRYEEVRARLAAGEVHTVSDLITYNLNITRFVDEVVTSCQKPTLLQAFYDVITQVKVLDPTCGSGAFLFAALNILRPLYQTCLRRMQELAVAQESLFARTLGLLKDHRSQEYFILKSIIINNLYGVDIMEEAVEICRLRLFLKLVAQVNQPADLEPLPDIDFNVLASNTLIGFTGMEEIRRVVTTKLFSTDDTEKTLARIDFQIREIERDEQVFRHMQTVVKKEKDGVSLAALKQRLREKLKNLREELDPYLATEYDITKEKFGDAYAMEFDSWQKSHQPFHWWVEFYEIMRAGGFDVIIGNPPYVEWSKIENYDLLRFKYKTRVCGNLYTVICEQAYLLCQ